MTPTTVAGKVLLDTLNVVAWFDSDNDYANSIAAVEREAREGYVPASLSPEWHAELSMSFDEGREAGAQQERERLRALLYDPSDDVCIIAPEGGYYRITIGAFLSDPEPQP